MQDPAWLIRKSHEIPVWREVDGITVFGAYTVNEQHTLTLRTPYGIKSTQLGGSTPRSLAKLMLRELFEDMHWC
jgi:hypothetical protein